MTLRPSNLPKLAICACFEPNPIVGDAAERGTKLDGVFRRRVLGATDRFLATLAEFTTQTGGAK